MVLAALAAAVLGSAAAPSNPDAFLQSTRKLPPRVLSRSLQTLVETGQVSSWEERLGVPTFFWAPRPTGAGPSLRAQGLTPTEAARQHLLRYAPLYGLGGATAASARARSSPPSSAGWTGWWCSATASTW